MHNPFDDPNLRPDLPTYPVHVQLIRVTGATVPGPSGVAQSSGVGSSVLAPPLYVAYVQQRMPDTGLPRDREPCLAADINGVGIGSPPAGGNTQFFLGRLAGTWTGLPVYEIIASPQPGAVGGGGSIIHGTLQNGMSYQGNDKMYVWKNSGSGGEVSTGVLVSVYDWLLSAGQSIAAGKHVIAGWDAQSERYYVIGAQCP